MLSKSNFPIDLAIKEFTSYGHQAAYIVPTKTGLTKSILDAHISLRKYVYEKNIHNFDSQPKGQEAKVKIAIGLITPESVTSSEMSLYRPLTKSGDPRIWVSGLPSYCSETDLLAFIVDSSLNLYVVNCSNPKIWETRNLPGSPLNRILTENQKSAVAEELLNRLIEISSRGFIESLRPGDTGVGFTLETLLGIEANSSKSPDFKGIEIKSGRVPKSGKAKTRATLFSKVPNWSISAIKSPEEVISKHGYFSESDNRWALYCTVASVPNSQGLYLNLNEDRSRLINYAKKQDGAHLEVVSWNMDDLNAALAAKHEETFWVQAQVKEVNGSEHFHFSSVTHTSKPIISNFSDLIEIGKIQMDYTMHIKPNGKCRDHGYLFKIWKDDLGLLFPPPKTYALTVN